MKISIKIISRKKIIKFIVAKNKIVNRRNTSNKMKNFKKLFGAKSNSSNTRRGERNNISNDNGSTSSENNTQISQNISTCSVDATIQNSSSLANRLRPGYLYILNQKFFSEKLKIPKRRGTDEDMRKLRISFLKYKLEHKIWENYFLNDIKKQMDKVKNKDFSKNSCIVFAILSHGIANNQVWASDTTYSIDNIILKPLLENKTIMNKPIIFIIQACKEGTNECMENDIRPNTNIRECNVLWLYSTLEGRVSYRNPKEGSEFIQTFCDILRRDGETSDILTIMKNVINHFEKNGTHDQVPCFSTVGSVNYTFGHYM